MAKRDDVVVDLGAYVPDYVRKAAKRAYVARLAYYAAQAEMGSANRALSSALHRAHIKPEKLHVGDLDARALVPADHAKRGRK